MFDFFKDAYAELNGLDIDKMEEERKIKKEKTSILKKNTKVIITIVGCLYLIMAGINIYSIIIKGFELRLIKYTLFIILDLFILIGIHIKIREIEWLSIIGIIIFIGVNFFLMRI